MIMEHSGCFEVDFPKTMDSFLDLMKMQQSSCFEVRVRVVFQKKLILWQAKRVLALHSYLVFEIFEAIGNLH